MSLLGTMTQVDLAVTPPARFVSWLLALRGECCQVEESLAE